MVIFVQENHTTDNYFSSLAPLGVDVATGWPAPPAIAPANVARDNSREAWFTWLSARLLGRQGAFHYQYDTAAVLPFYDYLARTGAFFENHFSVFGTDSTPNHMVIVGGQATTLQNPSGPVTPSWDMPSVPQLAERQGISWTGYAGADEFPFLFYKHLAGSSRIVPSEQFLADAKAGRLARLSLVYNDARYSEGGDPRPGHDRIWQYVSAAVAGGEWPHTVFMLTWDDWGGWDDHVLSPVLEYTPDNVPVSGGPRVPLMLFGGPVLAGIDTRWCSHAAIPKTAMQVLGLPSLGVPRADADGGLIDRVDWNRRSPLPPPFGTAPARPPAGSPTPDPPPPYPSRPPTPLAPVFLNGGTRLPAPHDVILPLQPAPPTSSDPTRLGSLTGSV
ncbi:MAG: alkaline phosphatase family protein [Acidimicrobiales bacterium]